MTPRERIAYLVLLALGALDAAAYSVIAPVTPEIARITDAGPAVIGALVASFPVGILIGFVLAAQRVKRGRSKAVLLGSLVLVGALLRWRKSRPDGPIRPGWYQITRASSANAAARRESGETSVPRS